MLRKTNRKKFSSLNISAKTREKIIDEALERGELDKRLMRDVKEGDIYMYLGPDLNSDGYDILLNLSCNNLKDAICFAPMHKIEYQSKLCQIVKQCKNFEVKPALCAGLIMHASSDNKFVARNASFHPFVRARQTSHMLRKYVINETDKELINLARSVYANLYYVVADSVINMVFENNRQLLSDENLQNARFYDYSTRLANELKRDIESMPLENFIDKWEMRAIKWKVHVEKKMKNGVNKIKDREDKEI